VKDLLDMISQAHILGMRAKTQGEYTAAGEKAIRLLPEIRDKIRRLDAELMALKQAMAEHDALFGEPTNETTFIRKRAQWIMASAPENPE